MKRLRLAFVAASIAALAACGGGGGSTPSVLPSSAPPVPYTSYLRFTGALAGHVIQSDLRQARALAPMAAGTPIPIMVVTSDVAGADSPGSGPAYGGQVQAVVSPVPSASNIPVTFSNTNSAASITATPTPLPGQTPIPLPTGVIAVNNVTAVEGTTNVQSAGTATAAIGSPVNQSPTTAVYSYKSISVDCLSAIGTSPGWKLNPTTLAWEMTSDPASSDIYVIGPGCPGAFAAPTASGYGELHFPGGGLTQSTDNVFAGISASQWTNTETSVDMQAIDHINADGSQNTEVIAKTRDGAHIFKLFPNSFGPSPGGIAGAVEIAGSSVDGF